MSISSVASQQSATTTTGSSNALATLSGNLDTFLQLLMTQLQNQDPTSPLDSSQFTSQLVQYSSVEQQIQTNTNLTNLIQMTQGSEVVQSAALFGKSAEVTSDHLSLQSGHATVKFAAASSEPVTIVVSNAAGSQVAATTVKAAAGSNSWSWDGTNSAGNAMPDGSYKVSVLRADSAGNVTALPTTVVGTVTGVSSSGSALTISMGSLSVDFAKLVSL